MDINWLKEENKKLLIINECIYIVSEIDSVSDIAFRKRSCDPKYIAKNSLDQE